MSRNFLISFFLFLFPSSINSLSYKEEIYQRTQKSLYKEAGDSHVIEIKIIYDTLTIEAIPNDEPTSAGHFLKIKKPRIKSSDLDEEVVEFITISQYVIRPRKKLFDVYAKIESKPAKIEVLLNVDLPTEYRNEESSFDVKPIFLSQEPKIILKGVLRFFGVATVRYSIRGPKKIVQKIKTNDLRISFTVVDSSFSN